MVKRLYTGMAHDAGGARKIQADIQVPVRPKELPKAGWFCAPNAKELPVILELEEMLEQARNAYIAHYKKKQDFFRHTSVSGTIRPVQYMNYLAHLCEAYERHNATFSPARYDAFEARLRMLCIPELPAQPLAVMAYGKRPSGTQREYAAGQRCDYDHTPPVYVVEQKAAELLQDDSDSAIRDWLTARSVPGRLHQKMHRENGFEGLTPYRAAEAQCKWYRPHLQKLGFAAAEIQRSEERIHDRNEDLGIYR